MPNTIDTPPLSRSAKAGTMRWRLSDSSGKDSYRGYLIQALWPSLSYQYVAAFAYKVDGGVKIAVHSAGVWGPHVSTDGIDHAAPETQLFVTVLTKPEDEAFKSFERLVGNFMHDEFLPSETGKFESVLAIQ